MDYEEKMMYEHWTIDLKPFDQSPLTIDNHSLLTNDH